MTTLNQVSETQTQKSLTTVQNGVFVPGTLPGGLSIVVLGSVPPRSEVYHFTDEMFDFLFPVNSPQLPQASVRYAALVGQLKSLLKPLAVDKGRVVDGFFAALPILYGRLLEDAKAALAFDPAATGLEEVIAAYPGFYATAIYRLAHELAVLGVPMLPRMMSEYAHGKTGIDIHPTAQIGRAFVIDHGTGTVIGATARIGHHVKIYHGVTLGALQVDKSMANIKRHPTVEDHVTIYANATVLGGETVVGHHSVLGGNVWVTRSVPPHSQVFYSGKNIVRNRQNSQS